MRQIVMTTMAMTATIIMTTTKINDFISGQMQQLVQVDLIVLASQCDV